jgi:hypothetical protein
MVMVRISAPLLSAAGQYDLAQFGFGLDGQQMPALTAGQALFRVVAVSTLSRLSTPARGHSCSLVSGIPSVGKTARPL